MVGTYTIALPTAPEVGDTVTFVGVGGAGVVTIDGAGSDRIHAVTDTETLGNPPYASRSFVYADAINGWVAYAEKSAIQSVASTQTLARAGATQLVLADTSSGNAVLTLPLRSLVGDRITVVKMSAAFTLTVQRNGSDQIDGFRTAVTLSGSQTSLTLVRTSSFTGPAWTTVGESIAMLEATDSVSLALNTATETHVMVRTSNVAWIAGTKTVSLPALARVGAKLVITDVDGAASSNPITIPGSSVLGTTPGGSYRILDDYGSVTLIAKSSTVWVIASSSNGLVDGFTQLARVDGRVDSKNDRMRSVPMFNWSHRRVAVHAEFAGCITNALPVDGFTPGGTMSVSQIAGSFGQVGVMRCTVPDGTVGYLHLGTIPASALFLPGHLLGFRAILKFVTANPGVDYVVDLGFGDDISLANLGSNGLFLRVGVGASVLGIRRTATVSQGTTSVGAVVANKRTVLEYYLNDATWDPYLNGVRGSGLSNNIPSSPNLNFGMRVSGGGASDYLVDVDSFTIFTSDMGTRFDP